jgi:RNA polymerase sigma-70 factor (ECF subfamily)
MGWDNEEVHMPAESSFSQASFAELPAARTVEFAPPARNIKSDTSSATGKTASVDGLIARLKSGDEAALTELFERHSAKLYNVALRILGGDASDAEEVIQDVFLTAFRKANMFHGHSQFSTWLYRLTVNAALGRIRRSKKHKEVVYDEFLPKFKKDGHHQVRPVIDWSDTLDEHYNRKETQQLIGCAIEELKPVDRSVIILSDLEGISDREIAETLNLTVSAVKTRLHRARLFLRGKLAVHFGHSAT